MFGAKKVYVRNCSTRKVLADLVEKLGSEGSEGRYFETKSGYDRIAEECAKYRPKLFAKRTELPSAVIVDVMVDNSERHGRRFHRGDDAPEGRKE